VRILVVGGAGYVGSTSVETFLDAGHDVTVYDNLKTGHRDAVVRGVRLVVGSLSDQNRVERVLREHRIQAVLHCAARSLVSESMEHPELYYR
jgi:UDP-glucose 4-epimerase